MAEKLKPSRYNHFVLTEDDKCLAFNALSCGLAEFDKETYDKYKAFAEGLNNNNGDTDEELLKNLKMGGFLIDEDVDELDGIRAGHYRMRFGNTGFGLTLIPTYNCNFACDYCYENSELHSMKPSEGSVMSDEVCGNIVKLCEKEIKEKSSFAVTWYGGEPLMAKHIIKKLSKEFIRICDEKESKYHAGIITNGYLLTKENLDFLIDSRVTFAQVTIDGPKEIHDKRRCLKSGGGTYDQIMSNLSNIKEDTPLSVSIRVNVDKRNEKATPVLLEDLKSRGIHLHKKISMSFGQVFHVTGACPDISTTCMVTPEFSNFLANTYKLALEMGFKQTSYPFRMLGNCGAVGSGSALIEPNSNVQSCWETVGLENKRIGVLDSDGIKYEDNYLKWMGWTPFNEECTNCDILPICMSGCPYRSVYPESQVSPSKCISWKYNLSQVLPLMKVAQEKQLLSIPRGSCGIDKKNKSSQISVD